MATYNYADAIDFNDRALAVSSDEIDAANAQVEAALIQKGIDPSAIELPNIILKNLAVHYALHLCATRNIVGEESPLADKSRQYRQIWQDSLAMLSPATLGLTAATGGIRAIRIGRA